MDDVPSLAPQWIRRPFNKPDEDAGSKQGRQNSSGSITGTDTTRSGLSERGRRSAFDSYDSWQSDRNRASSCTPKPYANGGGLRYEDSSASGPNRSAQRTSSGRMPNDAGNTTRGPGPSAITSRLTTTPQYAPTSSQQRAPYFYMDNNSSTNASTPTQIQEPSSRDAAAYQKVAFEKDFPSLKDAKQPMGYAPREAPYKPDFMLASRVTTNWTSKLAEAPAAPPAASRDSTPADAGITHASAGSNADDKNPAAAASNSAASGNPGTGAAAAAPHQQRQPPQPASSSWGTVSAAAAGSAAAGSSSNAEPPRPRLADALAASAAAAESAKASEAAAAADKMREQLAMKQSRQLIPVIAKADPRASAGSGKGSSSKQQTLLGTVAALRGGATATSSNSNSSSSGLLVKSMPQRRSLSTSAAADEGASAIGQKVPISSALLVSRKPSQPLDKPLTQPRSQLAPTRAPAAPSASAPAAASEELPPAAVDATLEAPVAAPEAEREAAPAAVAAPSLPQAPSAATSHVAVAESGALAAPAVASAASIPAALTPAALAPSTSTHMLAPSGPFAIAQVPEPAALATALALPQGTVAPSALPRLQHDAATQAAEHARSQAVAAAVAAASLAAAAAAAASEAAAAAASAVASVASGAGAPPGAAVDVLSVQHIVAAVSSNTTSSITSHALQPAASGCELLPLTSSSAGAAYGQGQQQQQQQPSVSSSSASTSYPLLSQHAASRYQPPLGGLNGPAAAAPFASVGISYDLPPAPAPVVSPAPAAAWPPPVYIPTNRDQQQLFHPQPLQAQPQQPPTCWTPPPGAAGGGGSSSKPSTPVFQVPPEEEAFLRSLGWTDADDDTDDVLTEEEIAAFKATQQQQPQQQQQQQLPQQPWQPYQPLLHQQQHHQRQYAAQAGKPRGGLHAVAAANRHQGSLFASSYGSSTTDSEDV